MGLRVTADMLYRNALADVDRLRRRLAQTQERASSGLRINRPSDDPSGTAAATLVKAELASTAQFRRNLTNIRGRVLATETAIGNATDVLIRARELALQGATDTIGDQRDALAREVEKLHQQLVAEANKRTAGDFIFSGYATRTVPFVASGPFVDGSPSPTVAFAGDASEIQLGIDEGVQAGVSLNGRRVFMGDGDGNGVPDAGREDLFDVLADLRDALVADDVTTLRNTLTRLDVGLDQLSGERTRIGAVIAQLEAQDRTLEVEESQLAARLSDLQDADAARVYSDLVIQENALRGALEATTRLLQPSLLDFLS
jgi:flagellar hook-associated protein 3 FlgL